MSLSWIKSILWRTYPHRFTGSDSDYESEYDELEFDEFVDEPLMKRQVEYLCRRDSKDGFVDVVEKIPRGHKSMIAWVLVTACSHNAKACVSALIDGETRHKSVDLNCLSESGFAPLHGAAAALSPELTVLLLQHGAQPTLKNFNAGMPLHLGPVSFHRPPWKEVPLATALRNPAIDLKEWCPSHPSHRKRTIQQLLAYICHPKMDNALKTIRQLLRMNFHFVDDVIFDCTKRGSIVQLAFLILAARRKDLRPEEEIFQLEEDMTREEVIRRIEYFGGIYGAIHEFLLAMHKGDDPNHRRIMLTYSISVLLLQNVFSKAGDAIDTYLLSQDREVTEEAIGELIKDVKFNWSNWVVNIKFTHSVYQEPIGNILDKIYFNIAKWRKYRIDEPNLAFLPPHDEEEVIDRQDHPDSGQHKSILTWVRSFTSRGN